MSQRYQGKAVSFLTQHGKVPLISPILEPALGCQVIETTGYDTDLLGTFTGTIQRLESQIDTARQKARIGMDLSGLSIGLASEGAFGADPIGGFLPWNVEILVWLDDVNQVEVVGIAQGPSRHLQRSLQSVVELDRFCSESGFPSHHLVLRPASPTDRRVRKGLHRRADLLQAFAECLNESSNQRVFAEHDLRAFCNPARQIMIQRAAHDLLTKIQSCCPHCAQPGFCITRHTPGLPCQTCKRPTRLAQTFLWTCTSCSFVREENSKEAFAGPERCDFCNP